jgi:hypothetical protein
MIMEATCKLGEKGCWNDGRCRATSKCDNKVITNADRIRAMSDEELAWELMTWRLETEAKHQGIESNYPNTQKSILEWLKQPVEK